MLKENSRPRSVQCCACEGHVSGSTKLSYTAIPSNPPACVRLKSSESARSVTRSKSAASSVRTRSVWSCQTVSEA
ncbi:MAG: hypothetical protein DMF91_02790 [Acidobacteria bacterium]|nr:MAG: hypothetical protein DMF91_02790 [Acidobacteriota bacterium]